MHTILRIFLLLLASILMVTGFETKNPSFVDTLTGIVGIALAVWVLFFARKKEE